MNEILPQAKQEGRAVCAFNVANLETLLSVFKAAEELNTPIIIQVYQRLFNDERAELIGKMTACLAEKSELPVVLHLDHGVSAEQIQQAIDAGYTSVMIDGSQLPFEENIELTAQCVKIARSAGVSIEAEIGHIPFGGGDVELSTAAEAVEFVERTGVDALAVSIGTAHGFYKKEPKLDIDRAREIGKSIPVPMVLHGGTGVPAEEVKKSIACGVAKINIATELQHLFMGCIKTELEKNGEKFLPVDLYLKPVEEKIIQYVKDKIKSFA
jgi:ketose-bisphosphate aldolase